MDDERLLSIAEETARTLPGASCEHPFGPHWEVFKVGGKIFLLTTEVVGVREPASAMPANHGSTRLRRRDRHTAGVHPDAASGRGLGQPARLRHPWPDSAIVHLIPEDPPERLGKDSTAVPKAVPAVPEDELRVVPAVPQGSVEVLVRDRDVAEDDVHVA
jgi:hypothetical protein